MYYCALHKERKALAKLQRQLLFPTQCWIMEQNTRTLMNPFKYLNASLAIVFILGCGWPARLRAESPPQISRVQRTATHDIALTLSGQAGTYYQLQAATN